jgi:hypothetical protein
LRARCVRLAPREFALGIEALEHSVRGDPLHIAPRMDLGVLAVEDESVDPRL